MSKYSDSWSTLENASSSSDTATTSTWVAEEADRHWLPWARCNLHRNPFGELTRQERAELAVVDVDTIVNCVGQKHRAVQLVGRCGRGKTTRMLAIQRRMPDASYTYIPEDGPCPAIAEGFPVLIDEAQRLPRQAWRQLLGTGLPVVLATHWSFQFRLRRFGYVVDTQRIGAGNTAELVCQLLNRRIEASRLGRGPLPLVSLADAEFLVERFGSDIRSIEHHLYERAQTQVSHHGEMRFVN